MNVVTLCLAAAVALALPVEASAGCRLTDLAGPWTLLGTDGQTLCKADIPVTGKFTATCYSYAVARSYTMTAAVTIDATCKIGGTARIDGETVLRQVEGRSDNVGTGILKPNVVNLRLVETGVDTNNAVMGYRN